MVATLRALVSLIGLADPILDTVTPRLRGSITFPECPGASTGAELAEQETYFVDYRPLN